MNIYKTILILHVISGFTALFVGLIPIFSKKGSNLHKKGGMVYFWGMTGVLLTTIALFSIKPDRLFFLLLIGIFSFYITFSGVRSVRFKTVKTKAAMIDWAMAGLVFISACIMILYAGYHFLTTDGSLEVGILLIVFGGICLWQTGADLLKFNKLSKGVASKEPWIVAHIAKMGGAYIATCTAFFVVNIHFLPPLLVWLAPSVIGGYLLTRATRKYKTRRKAAI